MLTDFHDVSEANLTEKGPKSANVKYLKLFILLSKFKPGFFFFAKSSTLQVIMNQ